MSFSTPLKRTDAARAQRLDWDSEHFGREIARVEYEGLQAAGLAETVAGADRAAIDCLYLLVPAADTGMMAAAEGAGFRCVDLRVTLAASLEGTAAGPAPAAEIRDFRESDMGRLLEIAKASHGDSRFFADPHFERGDCERLYERWIERSCRGWADFVLVAETGGEPAGYITCHLSQPRASIGLVAVSGEARGSGLGSALVRSACERARGLGAARASVVTQGSNPKAQRLYQRCGFVTESVEVWFHRWRP